MGVLPWPPPLPHVLPPLAESAEQLAAAPHPMCALHWAESVAEEAEQLASATPPQVPFSGPCLSPMCVLPWSPHHSHARSPWVRVIGRGGVRGSPPWSRGSDGGEHDGARKPDRRGPVRVTKDVDSESGSPGTDWTNYDVASW